MRAIDADRLLQVLETNFGHTGGADVMRQLIEAQPTLTQPNEPLTCEGCMYAPELPYEIHCRGCARLYADHYLRLPEGEEDT